MLPGYGLVGGGGGSYLPISSMLVYEGCTVQGTPAMGDFKWAKEYKTGLWEMPGKGKRFFVASHCFIMLTTKRFMASKLNFIDVAQIIYMYYCAIVFINVHSCSSCEVMAKVYRTRFTSRRAVVQFPLTAKQTPPPGSNDVSRVSSPSERGHEGDGALIPLNRYVKKTCDMVKGGISSFSII